MSPFTIYFDDSGTHPESNTAVAACYVSTAEKWARLEREWHEIAAKEGFETFHMAEFAAGRGEFEGWDDAKRRFVLGRLCSLINIRVRTGFIAGVRKPDYDEVVKKEFRKYCGRYHYSFALRTCVTGVRGWRNEFEPSCTMQYVFDQMGKGKGEIIDVMNKAVQKSKEDASKDGILALSGYSFEDKKSFLPLQAADILAWTSFQYTQYLAVKRPLSWIAREALDLVQRAPLKNSIFNRASLEDWAAKELTEAKLRGVL